MGFAIGLLIGITFHFLTMRLYKKILITKANTPKQGMSNVEYLFGKPYVILPEEEYIKNCKVWYE